MFEIKYMCSETLLNKLNIGDNVFLKKESGMARYVILSYEEKINGKKYFYLINEDQEEIKLPGNILVWAEDKGD